MFKNAMVLAVTAIVAATSFISAPTANAAVDVYTTPGVHDVNGRIWRTTCQQYTSDIERCRAEIKSGGKFVFNNLTYKPVDHRVWEQNPLASPGFFTSGGRQWVTSCNDQWTGANGCRSLIKTDGKWVFNNLVQVNTSSMKMPTSNFNIASGTFAPQYATTLLNIWDDSTGKSFSGAIERGARLATTGTVRSGRSQVKVNGSTKWVSSSYVSLSKPAAGPSAPSTPVTADAKYTTALLNVWDNSTGSSYTGLIPKAVRVLPTGKTASGRAEIIVSGQSQWVTAKYLTSTAPDAGRGPGPGGIGSGDKSLNRGWSSGLDKVNRNATMVARHVWANYSGTVKTMYGWSRRTTPDHPAGRAVDVMISNWKTSSGKAKGWEMAKFYRANAKQFGISYIIFDQQIWSVRHDSKGWRPMADRGGNTANHKDHLHINTYDNNRSSSTVRETSLDEMGEVEDFE